MNLPQLPQDKANHFVYGAVLCASCHWAIGPWALAVVCVAAIGKELYDQSSGKGCPEIWDAAWTIIGGGLVLL